MSDVAENLQSVRARIAAAAARAGRPPDAVRLVAVTKGVAIVQIRDAAQAGQTLFGENRVQEALPKIEALAAPARPLEWHLIGHLQTNKVKQAVGVFDLIHSVDSLRLARAIEDEAARQGRRQAILIQANLGEEPQKSGAAVADVPALVDAVARLPHLALRGLMTLPPLGETPEASRPYFRRLRELARQVAAEAGASGRESFSMAERLPELSMGMSADVEVAVEEGATLVRVGTAIFGPRSTSPRPFEGRGVG